ncbi:MAG: NAD-dependent epimerase/dehydratase family protein, partial [Deltaproteobacteria bacterium]|nr:NAD-dependent epimerase/dehydratase family protein [Deltaproteobacteria bacterium]
MNKEPRDFIREDLRASQAGDISFLDELRGGRILITGGSGFVGSWLAELLTFLNDEFNFGIQLNLLSRQAYKLKERLPHLASRPDVTLIDKDVRSVINIPEEIQWIIHAAGTPDNRVHASDPLKTMQVIAQGANAVLEAATRSSAIVKILHISSGLIYGSQPWTLEAMP